MANVCMGDDLLTAFLSADKLTVDEAVMHRHQDLQPATVSLQEALSAVAEGSQAASSCCTPVLPLLCDVKAFWAQAHVQSLDPVPQCSTPASQDKASQLKLVLGDVKVLPDPCLVTPLEVPFLPVSYADSPLMTDSTEIFATCQPKVLQGSTGKGLNFFCNTSLLDLMALDANLPSDSLLALPPVLMDNNLEHAIKPARLTIKHIIGSCGLQSRACAHLSLQLDWSLLGSKDASRCGATVHCVQSAKEILAAQLMPSMLPGAVTPTMQEWVIIFAMLLSDCTLPGCGKGPAVITEEIPQAAADFLNLKQKVVGQHGLGVSTANGAPKHQQLLPHTNDEVVETPLLQASSHPTPRRTSEAIGIFAEATKSSKVVAAQQDRCAAKLPPPVRDKADLAFFLGLNMHEVCPEGGHSPIQPDPQPSLQDSPVVRTIQPQVETTVIALPPHHSDVLQTLRTNYCKLAQGGTGAGVPPALLSGDVLEVGRLETERQQAMEADACLPGSRRELLRVYAAMAIAQQAALALVSFGIRYIPAG